MKYCSHCGQQVNDNAEICIHCGCKVGGNKPTEKSDDAPSGGFAFLCFLIPILGLILYLVWRNDYPLKAKSCGKGAIISVCISIGLYILIIVGGTCLAASYPSYYTLLI